MGGWYLIIYQAQFAHPFNLAVFLGGMAIVGIPGAAQIFSSVAGAAPTPPPSQPSPEPVSLEP